MPVPSVLAPSKNVTVPVAPVGVTAAVSVTFCPQVDGFTSLVSAVVVGIRNFSPAANAPKSCSSVTCVLVEVRTPVFVVCHVPSYRSTMKFSGLAPASRSPGLLNRNAAV